MHLRIIRIIRIQGLALRAWQPQRIISGPMTAFNQGFRVRNRDRDRDKLRVRVRVEVGVRVLVGVI